MRPIIEKKGSRAECWRRYSREVFRALHEHSFTCKVIFCHFALAWQLPEPTQKMALEVWEILAEQQGALQGKVQHQPPCLNESKEASGCHRKLLLLVVLMLF